MIISRWFARTGLSICWVASVLSLSTSSRAEELVLLPDGQRSLSALHQLIMEAKSDISLFYYEMGTCDSVTKVIVRSLADKVREGSVKVRVMTDGASFIPQFEGRESGIWNEILFENGAKISDRFQVADIKRTLLASLFARHGVDLKFFRPSNNSALFTRVHAKYAVADGNQENSKLVTGGRNLADSYYGLSQFGYNWIDRDVLVFGSSKSTTGKNALKHFDSLWSNSMSQRLDPAKGALLKKGLKQCLAWTDREEALYQSLKMGPMNVQAETKSCSNIKFLVDSFEFTNVQPQVTNWENGLNAAFDEAAEKKIQAKATTREHKKLLASSKKRIFIENYSFAPHEDIRALVNEKADKGVQVEVLTNQFCGSEEMIETLQTGSLASFAAGGGLARSIKGLPLTEHSSLGWANLGWTSRPFHIHSKVDCVDGISCRIGSANYDERSYNLNVESALFVLNCPDFASQVESSAVQFYSAVPSAAPRCENPNVPWYKELFLKANKNFL